MKSPCSKLTVTWSSCCSCPPLPPWCDRDRCGSGLWGGRRWSVRAGARCHGEESPRPGQHRWPEDRVGSSRGHAHCMSDQQGRGWWFTNVATCIYLCKPGSRFIQCIKCFKCSGTCLNCIHKSRYHSFYLLYDTVYTFVMTRTSVFMYIYCSLFYFVFTKTSEFSCTFTVLGVHLWL